MGNYTDKMGYRHETLMLDGREVLFVDEVLDIEATAYEEGFKEGSEDSYQEGYDAGYLDGETDSFDS